MQTSTIFATGTIGLPTLGITSRFPSVQGEKFMPEQRSFHLLCLSVLTDCTASQMIYSAVGQLHHEWFHNTSTRDPVADGSAIWVLSQCIDGCTTLEPISGTARVRMNFSGLPSFRVTALELSTPVTLEFLWLVCRPNIDTETREVLVDGSGHIHLIPPPTTGTIPPQNNIDLKQAKFLPDLAMSEIWHFAGPGFGHDTYHALGTVVQANMIFGQQALARYNHSDSSTSTTVTPLSGAVVAENYGKLVQSTSSRVLTGMLGRSYVPGRSYRPILVFTGSLPHIISSSILFALLSLLTVVSRFRSGREDRFTLYNAAKALRSSEVGRQLVNTSSEASSQLGRRRTIAKAREEEMVINTYGDRSISLVRDNSTKLSSLQMVG